MQERNRRVFSDINKLNEMLEMRKNGTSLLKIAKYYGCDHTSVMYWLKKLSTGEQKDRVKPKPKKAKEPKCPTCDMLLSAPYHIKYPCNGSIN